MVGLVFITQVSSPTAAVACFTLATFGVDMTISPSWSYCLDIGGTRSGAVSGSMNMIGNLGGTLSPIVVGQAVDRLHSWTLPFYIAAGVFAFGVVMWLFVDPYKSVIGEDEAQA